MTLFGNKDKSSLGSKINLISNLSLVATFGALAVAIVFIVVYEPVHIVLEIFLFMLVAVIVFFMIYYVKVIMIPLRKAAKIAGNMHELNLLEQSSDEKLFSSLSSLGHIGELIGSAALGINSEAKTRILNTEVALFALQSEINPHFLYNTLETIRNYAMNYGVPEIADMTQSLAKIFRYSISRPGEVATFADEINNVRNYIKIQQYRFPNRFQTVWLIDDQNDEIMKYSLPVLTLQPLVENALNHGLECSLATGRITIRATTTQSKLIVSISDNGVGMTHEKLNQIRANLKKDFYTPSNTQNRSLMDKSGISLSNVNQRIKLYYGKDYGLTITSMENFGTTVEVTVPKV